jgi:clumping factor A
MRSDADLPDDAAAGRTSSGQAAGPAGTGTPTDADATGPEQDTTVTATAGAADPSWPDGPDPAEEAPPPPQHDPARDPADEFDEPDPDDPDDEPLPQSVRPADAVRVARLDAEVLVVDGRPRYHLADCPHLVGRLTEGLPVAEAVELGFSPCGLCRPVDRLVAAAARR